MKTSLPMRIFWCLLPLPVAFLLPPVLALWVESHGLRLPLAEAWRAVIADYSRPLGDGLWVTTFYQLPPFVVLSGALNFFSRRLSSARLRTLCLGGLALITCVQVGMTINILKDIPNGEAEFIEGRYLSVSLVCIFLLTFLWFFIPPLLTVDEVKDLVERLQKTGVDPTKPRAIKLDDSPDQS